MAKKEEKTKQQDEMHPLVESAAALLWLGDSNALTEEEKRLAVEAALKRVKGKPSP